MSRYATKIKTQPQPKSNRLALWLVLAGLGLLLLAGWAVLRGTNQSKSIITVTGSSRLQVQNDVIDHGNVKLGTFIRDEIRVTNIGDQPLRFTREPFVAAKEGC